MLTNMKFGQYTYFIFLIIKVLKIIINLIYLGIVYKFYILLTAALKTLPIESRMTKLALESA